MQEAVFVAHPLKTIGKKAPWFSGPDFFSDKLTLKKFKLLFSSQRIIRREL